MSKLPNAYKTIKELGEIRSKFLDEQYASLLYDAFNTSYANCTKEYIIKKNQRIFDGIILQTPQVVNLKPCTCEEYV